MHGLMRQKALFFGCAALPVGVAAGMWALDSSSAAAGIAIGLFVTAPLVAYFAVRLQERKSEQEALTVQQLVEATQAIASGTVPASIAKAAALTGRDDLRDLACSLHDAATAIKRRLDTVETIAEIDRLLIESQGLETVVDALLPRLAHVLGCRSVSLFLIDHEGGRYARVYDHVAGASLALPVRRVSVESETLEEFCAEQTRLRVRLQHTPKFPHLDELSAHGIDQAILVPLQRNERVSGFLCLGQRRNEVIMETSLQRARDFASRLCIVLTSIAQGDALYRQAHHDPLTGLPNRQLLEKRLQRAFESPASEAGALLYIDLDHFKRINDAGGHAAGDRLLEVVAQRLTGALKDTDLVARLAGDEFAVILPGMCHESAVQGVAERLLAAIARPIGIGGRDHFVAASIGITFYPNQCRTIEALLGQADVAMYRAKEAGRNRVVYFEPEMNARMVARVALETGLHRALTNHQFELHFQPIYGIQRRDLLGVEALLRWPEAGGGARAPAEIIAAAEESGLILQIGSWIVEEAARHISIWKARQLAVDYVSINVSVRQLVHSDFVAEVKETLARHSVAPGALQIEIKENALEEGALVERTLRDLSQLGVRIAVDDFGTGYSSLNYLRNFPISAVKIDRSFVRDLAAKESARKVVATIVAMVHGLGKQVLAEGVETKEQFATLESCGCDGVQGFLLGEPMSADAFTRKLDATGRDLSYTARARFAHG